MSFKVVDSVLFRLPEDMLEKFNVEMAYCERSGQKFIETLVRDFLESKSYSSEKNYYGKTRNDIRKKLFPKKAPRNKDKA